MSQMFFGDHNRWFVGLVIDVNDPLADYVSVRDEHNIKLVRLSSKEKYDAIHVGASCDSIPIYLVHQLKKGGLMVLPLKLNNDKILSANRSAICTPIGKPESASPK